MDSFLKNVGFDRFRQGFVGRMLGVDGIIPPHCTYLPGGFIAEVWAYAQQLVRADDPKVACSSGVQRITYILAEPEDTGPQSRQVSGSRVVEVMVGIITAGFDPVPG